MPTPGPPTAREQEVNVTPRWSRVAVPAGPTPPSALKEATELIDRKDRRSPWHRIATVLALTSAVTLIGLASPIAADAATPSGPSLNHVIDALRLWLVGILAGLATLYLTIGGIRYLTAGGDPAEVERAKVALRSALWGYALAALAPLLVSILQSVVG